MASTAAPTTVTVEAFQAGDKVTLTWYRFERKPGQELRRITGTKRVILTYGKQLTTWQLTRLCSGMALYALRGVRGGAAVPAGLPWFEVGGQARSVPPSGGEGGEEPAPAVPQQHQPEVPGMVTERLIRS